MAGSSGLVVTSIRRAVLAVVVGGIATAMKATGTANSPTDILLWFLASVLMVVTIDWLIRHAYQYSFRVRKLAGWLPKSFIEGKWDYATNFITTPIASALLCAIRAACLPFYSCRSDPCRTHP